MKVPVLVALYSGLVVEGDAISGSLRAKLAALREAKEDGIDLDVVAFCQHSDLEDRAIQVVPGGVSDLLTHTAFKRASLHIFEFGIYYGLLNVMHLLSPDRTAAVYHNITPRALISDPVVQAAIDRSFDQKHLLTNMSHVFCDSEFNRHDLLEFGVPAARLSVLPLPGTFNGTPPHPRGQRSPQEPVRFLFVGRLVRAKGVLDLIAAAERLVDQGNSQFELLLAGRLDGSDAVTTDRISKALENRDLGRLVRFMPDASSNDIAAAYRNADAFVLPSYHEGYCVPIVEAFGAACAVIAYDNTNIPAVCGGLAELVPTGNVAALAEAMQGTIENLRLARSSGRPYMVLTSKGVLPEPEWRRSVQTRVRGVQAAHDEDFVARVRTLLSGSQPNARAEAIGTTNHPRPRVMPA